ncbi:class II SORL domain-containing protein [Garciella nitratireducens]|uniref:class II SORL domain-containing protein n=1 Tax=Garciella nitratireducens TaxID=218205 RepID=UPI000DE9EA8A|nr:class II SORL domain-containing protein [Garciella nitratireducens]RBP40630.1 superoxide reductase [Garciella nitratireducens]
MNKIGELIQNGDWKGEKHVPIIHAPKTVGTDETFELQISIGDEIAHPNTLEHHIKWIKVFFKPDNGKFPIELANFEFQAHGEGDCITNYVGKTEVKLKQSGTFYALSYCNLHGLWENSQKIEIK